MRSVFIGTGAYVGRIDHLTRLAFWAEEPIDHGFDPARLITVELSRTPNAAASQQISWDAVEVDDCRIGPNGSLTGTTIGPRWPEMQLVGAVYLEESAVARLPPAARPPCPPTGMGGRDYEFKTVVYWSQGKDPRAGRRYVGHHAEIVDEAGKLARVVIYRPGMSDRPEGVSSTMWIDLSSPDACDAGPDSLTAIAVGAGAKKGALFLAAGRVIDGREESATAEVGGRSGGPPPELPREKGEADDGQGVNNPKFPRFVGHADDASGMSEPKLPRYVGDTDDAPGVSSPKIPPLQGASHDAAGVSSPKFPPLQGACDDAPGVSSPKLPPMSGATHVAPGVSSPKLPPMSGATHVAPGVSTPKLPPMAGDADDAPGVSTPKIPPMQGDADDASGVSNPKIPPFLSEGSAMAGATGPKIPSFLAEAEAVAGVNHPKLPPMQSANDGGLGVSSPKLPPFQGTTDADPCVSGPKIPPSLGE